MTTALADPGFDREQFIDRKAEQEIFTELLEPRDEARILAIRAESGSGKSELLLMLQSNCLKAGIPVVLVSPEPNVDPVGMAKKVGLGLGRRGLKFDALLEMERARTTGDFARIGNSADPEVAIADARAANFSNATNPEVIGKKIEAEIYNEAPIQPLPPALDDQAREASLEAFVADLRRHCESQTVAILFDHYEKAPKSVRGWFEDILEPLFFDLERRPPHLVLAVAGQISPPFGSRWADDKVELVVRPRMLGGWEREDLADCCKLEGYEPSEDEFEWLYGLTRGMTVLEIVQMVRLQAKKQQRLRSG